MVLINEWLPNPAGPDASGEWIELANTGGAPVALFGWQVRNKAGKKGMLKGEIPAHGLLVVGRADSKLTLKNTDEAIALLDPRGALVDRSEFFGTAPEGKSFARVGGAFSFRNPTPGAPNEAAGGVVVKSAAYPFGIPLNGSFGAFGFFVLLAAAAVLITGLVLFVVATNENLSNLFFGRDEAPRE